jgi:hypothetical protein
MTTARQKKNSGPIPRAADSCSRRSNYQQVGNLQGQGFLIGKISSVELSPEGREGRYIVRFSEYAEINKPKMAHDWRNPVRYIELEAFGIDPTKLDFKPMPKQEESPSAARSPQAPEPKPDVAALDMAAAKKALAAFYNVPVTSIEITIRG